MCIERDLSLPQSHGQTGVPVIGQRQLAGGGARGACAPTATSRPAHVAKATLPRRQREAEGRSFAKSALGPDRAALRLHQSLSDGEPEAGAGGVPLVTVSP
jgi:hypothetical protein